MRTFGSASSGVVGLPASGCRRKGGRERCPHMLSGNPQPRGCAARGRCRTPSGRGRPGIRRGRPCVTRCAAPREARRGRARGRARGKPCDRGCGNRDEAGCEALRGARSRRLRAPACWRRCSAPHRSARSERHRIMLLRRPKSGPSRPSLPTTPPRHPRGGSAIAWPPTDPSSRSPRRRTETTRGPPGPSRSFASRGTRMAGWSSRARPSSHPARVAQATASAPHSPHLSHTTSTEEISSRSGLIAPTPSPLPTSQSQCRAPSISSSVRRVRSPGGAMSRGSRQARLSRARSSEAPSRSTRVAPRGLRSAPHDTMRRQANARHGPGTQGACSSSPAPQVPSRVTRRRGGTRSP